MDTETRSKDRPQPVGRAFSDFVVAAEAFMKAKAAVGSDPDAAASLHDAGQSFYSAFRATLHAFNSPANWHRDGTPIEPLPRVIAFIAGQAVDDLLDGRVPPSIQHLFFGRKRPGVGDIQQRAIEAAARFVRAVRDGLFEFPHAVDYVADLYEVAPRTVRRWAREYPLEEIVIEDLKRSAHPDRDRRMLLRHLSEQAELYKERRHVKTRT